VEILERLQIPAVQLALVPLVEAPSRWGRAAEALAAARIRVMSGMMAMVGEDYSTLESIKASGGVRPDGTWSANRRRAGAVARLAAEAGIGLVTFHAGFLPPRRDELLRRVMLDRLRMVADLFAERGIDVALETGQERAETLTGVLDELDRPTVGVNFDPANMILYGRGDPVAAFRHLASYVRQTHIKDARPTGAPGTWGREVSVGSGAVDWDAFFAVALRIRPELSFVIERESGEDREADVTAARALIERYLAG
jgi:sugar phosphate isomerase/epimerase